jgi:hypothetical protein
MLLEIVLFLALFVLGACLFLGVPTVRSGVGWPSGQEAACIARPRSSRTAQCSRARVVREADQVDVLDGEGLVRCGHARRPPSWVPLIVT